MFHKFEFDILNNEKQILKTDIQTNVNVQIGYKNYTSVNNSQSLVVNVEDFKSKNIF